MQAQARRDRVRLTNVKQVQIEQEGALFSIKATLSGPEGPVSFDFEPGMLVVEVQSPEGDAEPRPDTTRVVTVPEDVNIREPFLRIEDGVLIVDLPRMAQGYPGSSLIRAPRTLNSRSSELSI